MTTPAEIARIAGTLRTDQKSALLAAVECKDGELWTTYPMGDRRLALSGTLTPLGTALRDYLKDHGDE